MVHFGQRTFHLLLWMVASSLAVAVTPKAVSSPKGNEEDPRLKAPWVASIFHKNPTNGIWDFLCVGTITSSYTVLTSARCLVPRVQGVKFSSRPYHYEYQSLQVVAGLRTNDYNAKDEHTQYATVGQIRDPFVFQASFDSPYKDLAALRLKSRLNLTSPYVKDVHLTEQVNTILEANATKGGDTVIIAGFERSPDDSIRTRSKSASPLKVFELILEDPLTCLETYINAYTDSYYFDVLCAKSPSHVGAIGSAKGTIPCGLQGAGMITRARLPSTQRVPTQNENYYLMGIYSSNTASALTEGTLKVKNDQGAKACTQEDTVFFAKLGYLGRWGISHNFCDEELAMCQNDKCRPWVDLCNGKAECEDGSDETAKVCFKQGPCSPKQFRCKYGACVDKSKTCNGVRDCYDGSDEDTETVCKAALAAAG